jgi:H+/gluconate symporter-like permease
MKRLITSIIAMSLILFFSSCSPAQTPPTVQSNAGQAVQWWQVVSGIIAIPVALLGLIYTYYLIKKTNLESKKIQLEIAEKQNQFRDPDTKEGEKSHFVESVIIENQLVFNIILRFILLGLINTVWGFVSDGLQYLVTGFGWGIVSIFSGSTNNYDYTNVLPFIAIIGNILPTIGRLIIFLGLGWPLFKDVNKILGVDLKSIFTSIIRVGKNDKQTS